MALASGVMEKLGQPGHYTLFAPTNEAFEKLEAGYLERVMGDRAVMEGKPHLRLHQINSCVMSVYSFLPCFECAELSEFLSSRLQPLERPFNYALLWQEEQTVKQLMTRNLLKLKHTII